MKKGVTEPADAAPKGEQDAKPVVGAKEVVSTREAEVAKIGNEINEQAAVSQQPVAPSETGAPVPADVHLPAFGEQGAQQHTLNAQAGNTASTDVPAAITPAAPTPAAEGAANPAAAGPLVGGRLAAQPATQTVQPTATSPEGAAPEVGPSDAAQAVFRAVASVGEKVIADGPKGEQAGTVTAVAFGAENKATSYTVEIDDKPFNPMDPAHYGKNGRPTEDFPADMVRKA